MSTAVLAFIGVLIGAGVAALASVTTALVTARQTERRETRARLFDVRREVYVEAMRAAGIARHAVANAITEDVGVGVAQTASFMAQLELLGTPEVHRAYGELLVPLVEAVNRRAALPPDATADDVASFFGSPEMQQLAEVVGRAEVRLRDLMRRNLGNPPLGVVDLLGGQ